MSLKKAWNALIGKEDENAIIKRDNDPTQLIENDLFPVVNIPEKDLSKYSKIPLTGIAALGAAFAQLPQAARTIVQSSTTGIASDTPVYIGLNPKNVVGQLQMGEYGINGNVMQINDQGKKVIAGRMQFKQIGEVPVTTTSQTVMPLDPTMMMVAVALMSINQKLEKMQEGIEDILQFLELDKQSKQRGNLRELAEIADDYRRKCKDEEFCKSRNATVQNIHKEALQNIEFYQEMIAKELKKQKMIHISTDAAGFTNSIAKNLAEYQLACQIYAQCCFLDIMLRKDFESETIKQTTDKLSKVSERYNELYSGCYKQIEQYQRNSIDMQLLGGIGTLATTAGKAIGTVKIIKDVAIDDALIKVGESLGKINEKTENARLSTIESIKDNHVGEFIESLKNIDAMYNKTNTILTDGECIYVLDCNERGNAR